MANVKETTIDGNKYKFQKLPIRDYYKFMDNIKSGKFGILESYDFMLEHVVVEPRLTLDDFEELGIAHCEKVMAEANSFLTSKPGAK